MKTTYDRVRRKGVFYLVWDGEHHAITKETAEALGIPYEWLVGLLQGKLRKDQVDEEVKELQWRHKNGAGKGEKIYVFDGHRLTTKVLAKRAEISPRCASERLLRASRAEPPAKYEGMIRPLNKVRREIGRKAMAKRRSNEAAAREYNKQPGVYAKTLAEGEEKLRDIPSPGTWEVENLNPKYVGGSRSHVCGECSKGTMMRGD